LIKKERKKRKKKELQLSSSLHFCTQAVSSVLHTNIQGQKLVSSDLQCTTTCRRLKVQLNLTAAILRLIENKKINEITPIR